MKEITTIGLLLIAFSHVFGQVPDWENPKVFNINKEPDRAFFIPFDSKDQADKNNIDESSQYLLLNGNWKFHWSPTP